MSDRQKQFIAVLVAGIFVTTGIAFAQDASGSNGTIPPPQQETYRPDIRHPLGTPRIASTTEVLQQERSAREARRASTTETMQAKHAERNDRIASSTATRMERRTNLILGYGARIENRMAAAIDRLSTLANRIDARITKIEAANKKIQTAAAKTHLTDARAKIADARTALGDLTSSMDALASSTDPKTAFEAVRTAVNAVTDKTKAARKALVDTITSLKASIPEKLLDDAPARGTATSTTAPSSVAQ